MKPGTYACCSGCSHQACEMHRQGHPNPCAMQRWEGPRLRKPAMIGGECPEFKPINNCDARELEDSQLVT